MRARRSIDGREDRAPKTANHIERTVERGEGRREAGVEERAQSRGAATVTGQAGALLPSSSGRTPSRATATGRSWLRTPHRTPPTMS